MAEKKLTQRCHVHRWVNFEKNTLANSRLNAKTHHGAKLWPKERCLVKKTKGKKSLEISL
jgi:hypothetical protein